MSAQPKRRLQSLADGYRELVVHALSSFGECNAKTKRHSEQRDHPGIVAEYQQLASEAKARARRYATLADLAEQS